MVQNNPDFHLWVIVFIYRFEKCDKLTATMAVYDLPMHLSAHKINRSLCHGVPGSIPSCAGEFSPLRESLRPSLWPGVQAKDAHVSSNTDVHAWSTVRSSIAPVGAYQTEPPVARFAKPYPDTFPAVVSSSSMCGLLLKHSVHPCMPPAHSTR